MFKICIYFAYGQQNLHTEMKNLDRWIAAYIAMDDESRGDHLKFAESSAHAHPARRTPALILAVSNGGVTASPKPLNEPHNVSTLTLVKGVVKLK